MVSSVKSGERRVMRILSILPSCSAITRDLRQRARLVDGVDLHARGKTPLLFLVDVPAHVIPAVRLVLISRKRRRMDRVDGDPLARRQDADDAVARHRAAVRRKTDRHVVDRTADRYGTAEQRFPLWAVLARHFESDALTRLDLDPAFLLGRLRALVFCARVWPNPGSKP